ncbi:ATP-dependent DNA helicase [Corynebacterium alimapuense]|uniref:DNA 3'-5' helicase n=1 Tax=Corynebacterium alimapuense TaxID=1576874 RepID=A0A3M8K850_9CORY|nr:ATP-dependent DNA helicase [Corynebacterium alimapuense]RNE48732.1 ATP-dependent DNA helicase [Corynebacterium alimapuense]
MSSALPTPQVGLVPRRRDLSVRDWQMPLPESGTWRVRGPAGSGVTSLLIDTVVQQVKGGVDPSGILVVASSKETGGRIRRELTDRLSETGFASASSLVRSVHSLAFALLRASSEEPVRLITGAEQDAVIRELLAGQAADGRGGWSAEHRPALNFVGFARQLRDFLLRSVERGLSPEDLEGLGRQYNLPVWTAAGGFLREYEQTMALSGAASYTSYSASELVTAALSRPIESAWHTIVVDDAQHLDPKSAELISELIPSAKLVVIGGDPEQSIFHFRGASSAFLRQFPADQEIQLSTSRRQPDRRAVVVDSRTTQLALIADTARRAHLLEGVAWSDIAVVVRSVGQIAAVRRSLLAAGVPVHLNPTDVVLSEQRIVANLLLGIRALTEELSASELNDLLLGPIGGADPVTLRRLIRGLRRFDPETRGIDTLRTLLDTEVQLPDFGEKITAREEQILLRIRGVLESGHKALAAGGSVEETLWAVWSATGLADHLLAASLRGGVTGSQADRDLDAMMSLFDAAGDFVERRPTGSIHGFLSHITDQELPTGVRDRRSAVPDAVTLVTAHGTVGSQWGTVIVVGVQEGEWPSLGETGSLFEQETLVDLIDDGILPGVPVSHTADRLREERRLFHVATSRATDTLLVTAVHAPDADEVTEPSRFLDEFCRQYSVQKENYAPDPGAPKGEYTPLRVRVLSVPSLLAELRTTVCNPQARSDERDQAARQLARLAIAGVPGADPEQWWTTTNPSVMEPLKGAEALSPSRIEGLLACPLREVLKRLIEEEQTPAALTRGSLAHAYLEAIGRGVDKQQAAELTMAAFVDIQNDPQWRAAAEQEKFSTLLERTSRWVEESRSSFTQAGVEMDLDVEVIGGVRIRGRMDRLEKDQAGEHWVVDLKTGATAISQKATDEHAQLAAYQLALSRGAFNGEKITDPKPGQEPLTVGGGVLVYPGSTTKKISTREQARRSPEQLAEFATHLPGLAAELRSATLTARVNDSCDRCPVRNLCPVQPEGKTTIHA